MNTKVKPNFTLDRPVTYQIKVPGHLDESWLESENRMLITSKCEGDGQPITFLTGTIDQAALQGLLRRLYSLGVPLISVIRVEDDNGQNSQIKL